MVHVQSDPEILGGIPCFKGTRVPVETLFDHLRRGYSLSEYLVQFPTVRREDAEGVLAFAEHRVPGDALRAAG